MPHIAVRLRAEAQFGLGLLPPVSSAAAAALHFRAMAIIAAIPPGHGRRQVLARLRATLGPVSPSAALSAWMQVQAAAGQGPAASPAGSVAAAAAAWLAAVVAAAWPP